MSLSKALLFLLLLVGTGVNASTREEIERLYNPHGMAARSGQKQPADTQGVQKVTPAPRWFRLSNGKTVNLADWKVVLFMQRSCPGATSLTRY